MGFRSTTPPPRKTSRMHLRTTVNSGNFYELYYRHLVGATITAVGEDADGFHYFVAKRGGEEFRCEISRDEEGNGPGFLLGLPNPYDLYKREKS